MKNSILPLFMLCFFIISCDEVVDNGSSNMNTSTVNAQVNEPQPSPPKGQVTTISPKDLEKVGQVVSCSSINKKIKEAVNAAWVSSPFQVALKFGGDQMEARKKVISAESLSGGERFDKLLVTIEEEGLLDDSISGSMLILRMERKGAVWNVNKATRVWKCWPNRGHVVYNSTPCS